MTRGDIDSIKKGDDKRFPSSFHVPARSALNPFKRITLARKNFPRCNGSLMRTGLYKLKNG